MQGGWATTKVRTTAPRGKDAELASSAADQAAPRASKIPTGRSMSALLQSRSEAAAAVTESKQQPPQSPMPDIDSEDKGNELAASEYVADIFSYYKRVEPQFRVSPTYMSRQVSALSALLHVHIHLRCAWPPASLSSWMVREENLTVWPSCRLTSMTI